MYLLSASGSLLIREMFGARTTRTGSIAPSMRQRMSRKAESPFAAFGRRQSKRLTAKQVRNLYHIGYDTDGTSCHYPVRETEGLEEVT